MINQKMKKMGSTGSAIRELFEYGNRRKKEIGEDNVYDFSIGNPSFRKVFAVSIFACSAP